MSVLRLLPAFLVALLLFGNLASAQDDRPRRERGQRRAQSDRGDRGERSGRPDRGRRPPSPIIAALDADEDGEISAEEMANAVAALKKLDKNSDGKLTREEFSPPRQGRGGGPGGGLGGGGRSGFLDRMFEADADDDGKLSKDEVPERMRDRFDDIDSNGDGYVSRSELEERFAAFGRGGGGRGPGGRQGGGDRPRRPRRPE